MDQSRGRGMPLELIVFVTGAAALGIEIAAVRLLAPYFGASEVVWANTIGIVLVALAIGYFIGGKIADRRPSKTDLSAAVMLGAVLTALLPFVGRPLLNVGVQALDEISAGAFVGSMVATLLLLAIPMLVLGTVSPWALRIGMADVDKLAAGALAGRLYAISTVGSLVGTLACALILVPGIGTRRTFLLLALLLALVALPGLLGRWYAVVIPVTIAGILILPVGPTKAQTAHGAVIFETDTRQQYARVIEDEDGSRVLELNEGQSAHSLLRPGTVLTDNYWDAALVLPLAVRSAQPRRVAILGNAAGTVARQYAEFFPQTKVAGVELDGELDEIGRKYFELDAPNLTVHEADARPFLRASDERFDHILLDAYRQPYIPFYLTTREFFELAHSRLTPGGSVVVNVGHPEGSDRLERVLASTMATAFKHVWIDRTRRVNSMLVASDSPIQPALLIARTQSIKGLRPTGIREAARLEPAPTGGDIYTDDHAPVEWLIDRSIVEYAAGD